MSKETTANKPDYEELEAKVWFLERQLERIKTFCRTGIPFYEAEQKMDKEDIEINIKDEIRATFTDHRSYCNGNIYALKRVLEILNEKV